jgi:glycosyltransferase involved in cell wall biosynthesis
MAKTAKFVLTRHVLFPLKSFNRFALGNLSKAIAVSSAVETNLRKTFPIEKIELIPNGIDVENWSGTDGKELGEAFRLEHGIDPNALLIGTIGELKLLKGQRDFVLAAQIVAQKFPGARFVVVGKDNSPRKDFRRELKRLVKIFRLENRFLWLDWVEDTAPLLSALDIFVSASHSESFGLAILEAMAAGRAIAATETEGAKELLDEEAGKFVPIKEPVRLAEAVIVFLNEEKTRGQFGRKAQNRASEKFGLEAMIERTEKIYQDVLATEN